MSARLTLAISETNTAKDLNMLPAIGGQDPSQHHGPRPTGGQRDRLGPMLTQAAAMATGAPVRMTSRTRRASPDGVNGSHDCRPDPAVRVPRRRVHAA
jgi:hypothetical protein